MKSLLKTIIKRCWSWTEFLRRPLRCKFDSVMSRPLRIYMIPRLEGLEHGVIQSNQKVDLLTHDVNLALNSTVREIARLQMQIEVLQQMLEVSQTERNVYEAVSKAG